MYFNSQGYYLNRDYLKTNFSPCGCKNKLMYPSLFYPDTLSSPPLLFIAPRFPITIIFNYLYWTLDLTTHHFPHHLPDSILTKYNRNRIKFIVFCNLVRLSVMNIVIQIEL